MANRSVERGDDAVRLHQLVVLQLENDRGHTNQDHEGRGCEGQHRVALTPLAQLGQGADTVSSNGASIQKPLEILGKIQAVLVALCGIAPHGFFADRHQLRRRLWIHLVNRLGRLLHQTRPDRARRDLRARRKIGRLAGEDHVEDRPEGIDIRALVGRIKITGGLLRSHKGRSSHHRAVHRDQRGVRGVGLFRPPLGLYREVGCLDLFPQTPIGDLVPTLDLRQPPVHDVDLAETTDHDVGRLEITVNDTSGMGEGHGLAHADQDPHQAGHIPAVLFLDTQLDDLVEILPFYQPHGEKHPALTVDTKIMNGHDSRMVDLAHDLCLLDKPGHPLGITGRSIQNQLHGEKPVQLLVPDLDDLAHPSTTDLLTDSVFFLPGWDRDVTGGGNPCPPCGRPGLVAFQLPGLDIDGGRARRWTAEILTRLQ